MQSNEQLPDIPSKKLLSRILSGAVDGVRSAFHALFPPEDPVVAKLLMPKFRAIFKDDYFRIVQRFRSGELHADPDKKKSHSFLGALERDGIGTTFDAFEYTLEGYPQYSVLSREQQSHVRMVLLGDCGLMPGL